MTDLYNEWTSNKKGNLKYTYLYITHLKMVPTAVTKIWREETESQVQNLSLSDTSSCDIKFQSTFKEATKNTQIL